MMNEQLTALHSDQRFTARPATGLGQGSWLGTPEVFAVRYWRCPVTDLAAQGRRARELRITGGLRITIQDRLAVCEQVCFVL